MTVTMMREGETMKRMSEHMPRDGCAFEAAHGSRLTRPFSLKCGDVLQDLEHVKNGSMAHNTDAQKSPKRRKSLRTDPIMLCCEQEKNRH